MTPETTPCRLIDSDPNQPRLTMDTEELKQLARSIRELGQLQPVIVFRKDERFVMIDGHRRLAALGMAGVENALALVLDARPDSDTLLLTQLAANCMRVDLKPTEKALAFQRLKDSRGWSNTELAKAVHVSKAMVTRILSYLSLSPEARAKLDAGELPGSTAYAITRAADEATKRSLLDQALSGKLKRDDAQSHVRRHGKAPSRVSRTTFRFTEVDVTVAASERLDLSGFIRLWQRLGRECRKADHDGLDAETLERVLSSKHRVRK